MLNIGTLQLPVESATKTFAILAKRGAGKSYTGAVMAEEFYKNKIPFVVFDPIDVWWGLRLSADGKGRGLPVVVFGVLDNVDIKIDRHAGPLIARAVAKENVSCVISTFGMPKTGQRQLVAEFSEEILRLNTTPRHVFVEEAHEFVPQRVGGGLGGVFNAVSNLVVMGRNRKLGVTLINQRAATLNKDVLTQIDTLLALRNLAPQDRQILREWVEYHAAEGDFEEFIRSLPALPTGECWVWSPEFLKTFQRITIRPRETFHPDPDVSGEQFTPPALEQTDVKAFIRHFAETQASEAAAAPERHAKAASSRTPVHGTSLAARREEHQRALEHLRGEYEARLAQKDQELVHLRQIITTVGHLINSVTAAAPPPPGQDHAAARRPAPAEHRTPHAPAAVHRPDGVLHRRAGAPQPHPTETRDRWRRKLRLGKESGAGRMLDYLAKKAPQGVSKTELAAAAGLTEGGGAYRRYLKLLTVNKLAVWSGGSLVLNPAIATRRSA